MNIEIVKEKLRENIGKTVTINYNLGRNKHERFNCKIKDLYNYIFTVELDTSTLKTFMYSDVITKTVKIEYK